MKAKILLALAMGLVMLAALLVSTGYGPSRAAAAAVAGSRSARTTVLAQQDADN
jgi:hypothetical protein